MKITKDALSLLDSTILKEPAEVGGILGSDRTQTVSKIVFDSKRKSTGRMCCYVPDTDFLNGIIREWIMDGTELAGFFHTHFSGVRTLSCADKRYICEIMKTLPKKAEVLYFPIYVLPERELVCYKAEICGGEITIKEDELTVV